MRKKLQAGVLGVMYMTVRPPPEWGCFSREYTASLVNCDVILDMLKVPATLCRRFETDAFDPSTTNESCVQLLRAHTHAADPFTIYLKNFPHLVIRSCHQLCLILILFDPISASFLIVSAD